MTLSNNRETDRARSEAKRRTRICVIRIIDAPPSRTKDLDQLRAPSQHSLPLRLSNLSSPFFMRIRMIHTQLCVVDAG